MGVPVALTARSGITNALIHQLKKIDGSGSWNLDFAENVTNKLVFWDEVNDFPYISVVPTSETREYLPGGFKWGFLGITIRIYVYDEEPNEILEKALVDIETQIDANQQLSYDPDGNGTNNKFADQLSILSITTDEGLLAPYGVGEVTLEVRYEVS